MNDKGKPERWLTKEEFLSDEGTSEMTRAEQIEEMSWHDTVGQLDGVDLDSLSDEAIRQLHAEIVVYFINRQRALRKRYE